MAAPVFSQDDFLQALLNLLPTGRAWPRERVSTMAKALFGFANTYARLQARDNQLILEGRPDTTVELLPEWEESLGLPDPCSGPAPSFDARRAQVVARFLNTGGQSIPFFIAYAAALGYAITITYDLPLGFGEVFGSPFGPGGNLFTWTVNAPLAAQDNDVLECEFERLKPAHTIIIFIYS